MPSVIFYFESDFKDSAILLGRLADILSWLFCKTDSAGSGSHCAISLFAKNSRRSLVQLREISDIGSSAPQFSTEGLDNPFLKNGWNLFSIIYLIILYLSNSMSFIFNVKNCKNNAIQSTCNGALSVGHAEGDQTAAVWEIGTDVASQTYPIMSEVNTRKLLTTKRKLFMRL